jgi:hypothetical protein
MNQTKIQYALIAYKELAAAQQKVDLWSAHLNQRLGNLNDLEAAEFKKRTGAMPALCPTRMG